MKSRYYTPAQDWRPASEPRPRHRAGSPDDLTERQREILAYVKARIQTDGYAPAIREIKADLKISSTSVVAYNLKALERAGLLTRHPVISRGIRLPDESPAPDLLTYDGHEVYLKDLGPLSETTRAWLAEAFDALCLEAERREQGAA